VESVHFIKKKKNTTGFKAQTESNKIIVEDFNTLLSSIDRSPRQTNLRLDTIEQTGLTDIYRIFHPATAKYTFFSVAYGSSSKIDNFLGQKESLNKCKNVQITPCILLDHNGIKLELSQESMAHTCNPSYSAGRDQEDHNSKPVGGK
jgi:exonuclease III